MKRRHFGTSHVCPVLYDDIWMLVESVRGESLVERRCLNLVVNREPSFFTTWTVDGLDVLARGLLSRVMGVAPRSQTVLSPSEVSLEGEAALPETSQSAPPSAHVLDVNGFSWVIDELVVTWLGEQVLSLRMLSSWVTWACNLLVTGREFAFHRLQTMRWSLGKHGSSSHMNCFLAVNEGLLEASEQMEDTVGNPLPNISS